MATTRTYKFALSKVNNARSVWMGSVFRSRVMKPNVLKVLRVLVPTAQLTLSDYVTQSLTNKDGLDYRRLGYWTSFGCLYNGVVQRWVYQHGFVLVAAALTKRLPRVKLFRTKVFSVFLDQFFFTPFMYFPFFFATKQLFFDGKIDKTALFPSLKDMKVCWNVWIPAQMVTFALPGHARIFWMSGVALAWYSLLSYRTFDLERRSQEPESATENVICQTALEIQ